MQRLFNGACAAGAAPTLDDKKIIDAFVGAERLRPPENEGESTLLCRRSGNLLVSSAARANSTSEKQPEGGCSPRQPLAAQLSGHRLSAAIPPTQHPDLPQRPRPSRAILAARPLVRQTPRNRDKRRGTERQKATRVARAVRRWMPT